MFVLLIRTGREGVLHRLETRQDEAKLRGLLDVHTNLQKADEFLLNIVIVGKKEECFTFISCKPFSTTKTKTKGGLRFRQKQLASVVFFFDRGGKWSNCDRLKGDVIPSLLRLRIGTGRTTFEEIRNNQKELKRKSPIPVWIGCYHLSFI